MRKRIISLIMAVLMLVSTLPVTALAEELTAGTVEGLADGEDIAEASLSELTEEETPVGETTVYTGNRFTDWGVMCGQYAKPNDAESAIYIKWYTHSGDIVICRAEEGETESGGNRVSVDGVIYTTIPNTEQQPIPHNWIASSISPDGVASAYTCSTCRTEAKVIASMDEADNSKIHEELSDGTLLEYNTDGSATIDADIISRIEWVQMLVETFQMTVEGGSYPDNYYSDIDSTAEYYYDLMVAVDFGVIDLAAGLPFEPEEPATREFAAHTLNYCLAFQLDEPTYTYADTDVTYRDDVQVAVNRSWFALVDNCFLPQQAVTVTEAEAMMADAKEVYFGTTVSENYNSTYQFTAKVTVIPDGTDVLSEPVLDENGTDTGKAIISITNCPSQITESSIFAVYFNGIPVVYTAGIVTVEGSVTRVEATLLDIENTGDIFEAIDAQGIVEADMSQITPLDNTELTYYVEELDQEFQTYALARAAARKANTIRPNIELHSKVEVGHVSHFYIETTVSNPVVEYNINLLRGKAYVQLSFDLEVEYRGEIELKDEDGIRLFYWGIPGVGGLKITLEPSLVGGISGTQSFHIVQGISVSAKDKSDKVRLIKEFKSKTFALSADVTGEIGVVARFGVTDLPVFNAYIYAELDGRCAVEMTTHHPDGAAACECVDFSAYLYAEYGFEGSIEILFFKITDTFSKIIFDKTNSPLRVVHHYENGVKVPECTQDVDSGWQTPDNSPNISTGWANSSNNTGHDSNGEIYTIFDYTVDDDGNATITAYKGNAWTLIIPKTLDGHKVVAIGRNAFSSSQSKAYLKTVIIPEGVTKIEPNAFQTCLSLQKVSFPSTLKWIGRYAFYGCTALTSVELPAGLEVLDCFSFGECTSLRRVTLPLNFSIGNEGYIPYNGPFEGCTALRGVTFCKGITRIPNYLFFKSGLETITIPETVTTIGGSALRCCTNLTEINLPDSLTTIEGSYAFSENPKLTEITLPQNLETIGERAFSNCTALKTIRFPEGLKTIQAAAFSYCTSLTEVRLPDTLEEMNALAFTGCSSLRKVYIPASLSRIAPANNYFGPFEDCTALREVTFGEGITRIPNYLFYKSGLETITIPETVTTIGGGALRCCTNLTEINLPDSLTTIEGSYAFSENPKLTEITLPQNLETIGERAFSNCTALKTIRFPEGLKTIQAAAFSYCTSLTEVRLPDTLEEMNALAFTGCSSLRKVYIPASLSRINMIVAPTNNFFGPFEDCTALREVTFGEGITRIPSYLFYKSGLETITIPETVTTIGGGALRCCTNLTEINLPDSLTTIEGSYAFSENPKLTEITLPQNLETIGERAFSNCTALKTMTIPGGVTTIGTNVFYSCTSLESVVLSSGVREIPGNTFAECTKMKSITIPASVITIDSNAFRNLTDLTIYGAANSTAASFAASKGYNFVPLQLFGTISGDGGTAPVSIRIFQGDSQIVQKESVDGNYQIDSLVPGSYTMELSKEGCVPYQCTFAVGEDGTTTTLDAVLVARGNINGVSVGDADIEITDLACLYQYLVANDRSQSSISDETYYLAVADVNEDGTVDVYDLQRLYEGVNGMRPFA